MAYKEHRTRVDIAPDVDEAIEKMNGSRKGFNKAVNSLLRLALQIQERKATSLANTAHSASQKA